MPKGTAKLDQASNGRFILGLGVANSVMNERFGIAPFAPLAMIEEYAAVVRAVLAGSPTGHDGQVFRTGLRELLGYLSSQHDAGMGSTAPSTGS